MKEMWIVDTFNMNALQMCLCNYFEMFVLFTVCFYYCYSDEL